jgi:hypothetical protein
MLKVVPAAPVKVGIALAPVIAMFGSPLPATVFAMVTWTSPSVEPAWIVMPPVPAPVLLVRKSVLPVATVLPPEKVLAPESVTGSVLNDRAAAADDIRHGLRRGLIESDRGIRGIDADAAGQRPGARQCQRTGAAGKLDGVGAGNAVARKAAGDGAAVANGYTRADDAGTAGTTCSGGPGGSGRLEKPDAATGGSARSADASVAAYDRTRIDHRRAGA